MICKKCGNDTPDGFVFCRVCGSKLDYSYKEDDNKQKPKRSILSILLLLFIIGICSYGIVLIRDSLKHSGDIKEGSEKIVASLQDKQSEEDITQEKYNTQTEEIIETIKIIEESTITESVTKESKETTLAEESETIKLPKFVVVEETKLQDAITIIEAETTSKIVEEETKKVIVNETTINNALNNQVVKTGNVITFGKYLNDGNKSSSISWKVLTVNDAGEALLMSTKGIDCKKYNEVVKYTLWRSSTLRTWLNEYFYNSAFSSEEKQLIIKHRVGTSKNTTTGMRSGEAVYDYVAVPSEGELDTYVVGQKNRMCSATNYAITQGAYTAEDNLIKGNGYYWLRNNGKDHETAMLIDPAGNKVPYGITIEANNVMVRPTIWIKVK